RCEGESIKCEVRGAKCPVRSARCDVQGAMCRVRCAGCDVQGAKCTRHALHLAHRTSNYFTACFSALPALNRGTRRFGTLIVAPVCGLRALRALRFEVLKVPKPTNETESPFLSDLVMPSMSESTAAAALVFVSPVSLAIFWMTSCLFMGPPGKSP